jgi:hypothetical protein
MLARPAMDSSSLDGEATIKPKPRDTVIIGSSPFTWKAH